MNTEIQPLIDRIRKEALDEAETQAEQVVSEAHKKAEALVAEAKEKARQFMEQADKDAQVYAERSEHTLRQAARDVLLVVQQGIDRMVSTLVHDEVGASLNGDTLTNILGRIVDTYIEKEGAGDGLEVLLGREDREKLIQFFKAKYQSQLGRGIRIGLDDDLEKGFEVAFKKDGAYHTFTREAMADAIARFVRPELAPHLRDAAGQEGQGRE